MRLNLWTEIRTAWHVAEQRNVTRAAQKLGMHHSSVIRHIDALEGELGVKLFQRHPQGYTPTEAGEELLRTAGSVNEQLTHMMSRIENAHTVISGQLVLTTVPGQDFIIMPLLARYQQLYPQVELIYFADARNYELHRGEAHVALRAGPKPTDPDNIVSHLWDSTPGLYASTEYEARYGLPQGLEDLRRHRFVVGNEAFVRAPFNQWLLEQLPDHAVVMRTPQITSIYAAIRAGVGIGFLPTRHAPPDTVPVMRDCMPPEWTVPIWMVTHVDLHRSPKVQSLTKFLQQEVKDWPDSDPVLAAVRGGWMKGIETQ